MSFSGAQNLPVLALPEVPSLSFEEQVRSKLLDVIHEENAINVWEFLPGEKPISTVHQLLNKNTLSEACEFLPEVNSVDLLLTFFSLDLLRMDQLYMFFSEARRVVKPGGLLAIASFSAPHTLLEKISTNLWCRKYKRKTIAVDHYISPEDWILREKIGLATRPIKTEIILLKRQE